MDIDATGLEDAFARMHADKWSPSGEALQLLQSKGLQHTSMTIGDVLVDEAGIVHQVTGIGFSQLMRGKA
jgi:hypothetical protein